MMGKHLFVFELIINFACSIIFHCRRNNAIGLTLTIGLGSHQQREEEGEWNAGYRFRSIQLHLGRLRQQKQTHLLSYSELKMPLSLLVDFIFYYQYEL